MAQLMTHGNNVHSLNIFEDFKNDPIRKGAAQNPAVGCIHNPVVQDSQ
jgi:hypothetical protein